MNVAYIFRNNMASTFQLATMILPQLEKGNHGANVLGMFFFDDNLFVLREGDPVGERLASVASERGILLMMCDQCAVRRNMAIGTLEECGSGQVKASGTVKGVRAGCFPQLYEALSGSTLEQVITL
tara:strand:+ start:101 stop:478 length:378 start_codon:yes stop_codon:yes gene_type:complete